MQLVQNEVERQARLDGMKRRATGLLGLATVLFFVSRLLESTYPWLAPVRATAEAAMVGGLADWFAVTALFRHPMGIPIPHTAIVPARKDRVGRTLGAFVQKNFLTREVIGGKLESLHAGERLARWIAEPQNARTIARHAASSLASAAQLLRDDDVQAMIDRAVKTRIHETRVGPLVGKMLSVVTEGNRHQELLDEAIRLMARTVDENSDIIRARIEAESPWWVPTAVDERIYRKVVTAIGNTLVDIRDDPYHPLRARFDQSLREFIEKLQSSPETIARAEQIKRELLDADAVRRFSSSLWVDAKAALLRYAESPEGRSWGTIERALTTLGETILADPELMRRIDGFVLEAATFLVSRYQDEVADLIAQTVQGWDPEVTSKRVELAIGRDLQFIRINGTIVGGLAGLGLYVISELLR